MFYPLNYGEGWSSLSGFRWETPRVQSSHITAIEFQFVHPTGTRILRTRVNRSNLEKGRGGPRSQIARVLIQRYPIELEMKWAIRGAGASTPRDIPRISPSGNK